MKRVTASWLIVAACCLVLLAGLSLLGIRGQIGTEFSPELFQHRNYQTVYLFGFPVRHFVESKKWKLDAYLRANGYVPLALTKVSVPDTIVTYAGGHRIEIGERTSQSNPGQPIWYLVQGQGPSKRDSLGNFYPLCLALETFPSERSKWIPWSEAHPDIAKVLWPNVVELARNGDVDKAVKLLQIAEDSRNLAEYNKEIASQ